MSPLRVGLDLTALEREHVGVDSYLVNLATGLAELAGSGERELEPHLFINRADRPVFAELAGRARVHPVAPRGRPARLTWQQAGLPLASRLYGLDALHSPALIGPLTPVAAARVLTIHDLTQITRPEHHTRLRGSGAFAWGIKRSAATSQAILVPSRYVHDQVAEHLGPEAAARTRVTPLGISPRFTPDATGGGDELAALGITAPYILYVGTLEPRKGVTDLLDAYRELAAAGCAEQLVIAGKRGWGTGELDRRLAEPWTRGRVIAPGYVSAGLLPPLYAGARAFAYPSMEEGFGLPPLEAMASGVPTVAARASAVAENLEGAAELVAPGNPAELCAALGRVLGDAALRAELRERGLERAAGFSWQVTAERTLAAYRDVAGAGG